MSEVKRDEIEITMFDISENQKKFKFFDALMQNKNTTFLLTARIMVLNINLTTPAFTDYSVIKLKGYQDIKNVEFANGIDVKRCKCCGQMI